MNDTIYLIITAHGGREFVSGATPDESEAQEMKGYLGGRIVVLSGDELETVAELTDG